VFNVNYFYRSHCHIAECYRACLIGMLPWPARDRLALR